MKKKIISFFIKMNDKIYQYAENAAYPYIFFGVFGCITYPLYYLIWHSFSLVGYESFFLRAIITFMCLLLAFNKYWPAALKKFLPIYWYLTLTAGLPFLFTFLTLKNNVAEASTLNALTAIVLCILLVDILPLICILIVGIGLGFFAFYLTGGKLPSNANYPTIVITYLSVIIFGGLFAHRKEVLQHQRLRGIEDGMQTILGIIAHEIRTPLLSIKNGAVGLKKVFPILFQAYQAAKKHELIEESIPEQKIQILMTTLESFDKEVYYANMTINMLLANVKHKDKLLEHMEPNSMAAIINHALTRYPFVSSLAQSSVSVSISKDFTLSCSKVLMENVLFNLLKNALYFIDNGHAGQITIQVNTEGKIGTVIFQDTGQGIKAEDIANIFEKFYTRRDEGTGLGLAFCKMVIESVGGEISCQSEYGHYTRFIMKFPIIVIKKSSE